MWPHSQSWASRVAIETHAPRAPFWAPPLLALQFLTRVPVPVVGSLPPDLIKTALVRATGWFPLVGALVGLVTAAVISIGEHWWPRILAVLLALIVEARLTGAFHEDAVADTCDALGGGRDPQHTREIMKDSRIGSYGALGLLLAAALRIASISALHADLLLAALVASASFGRFMAVVTMRLVPPATLAQGLGKDIGGGIASSDIAVALVCAAPAMIWLTWLAPTAVACGSIAALLFVLWYRRLLLRKIDGSTGDALGFAAYAGQLIILLAAAAA